MQKQCSVCLDPNPYAQWDIKDYSFWKVGLHPNQYYLGRSVVLLKRHTEDLFQITDTERNELFEIGRILRDVLIKTFGADMINYSSLGNEERHLHVHFIPRYSHPVMFDNVTFIDERWGKNPSPYNKDFTIEKQTKEKIRDAIRSRLK